MSLTIQRPPEATTLLHRFATSRPPLSSQLVVGADECLVVVQYGAVLGIVPAGTFWLHPQQFPFLAAAVAGDAVDVELWFVRTAPLNGVQFGGSLGTIVDPGTKVPCTVRCFGELSMSAIDPGRLVAACIGQGATAETGMVDWAKSVVMQKLGDAVARLVRDGKSVLARDLCSLAQDKVLGELAELAQTGLTVSRFGSLMLSFPEETMDALKRAHLEAMPKRTLQGATATEARCPKCAKPHGGGKFCGECGAPVPAH